jgi:small GTP-binding protein
MSEAALAVKLVLVGNSGVGKTAIVSRLVNDTFDLSGGSTVGVEFKSYRLETDLGPVAFKIWDTAGQERFRSVTRAYFRNAQGALLVYSIDDEASFKDLNGWLADIQSLATPNAVIFLIGNKCDLEERRVVTRSQAEEFAKRNSLIFCETSAKEARQISDSFAQIGRQIQVEVKEGKLTGQYQTEPAPSPAPAQGGGEGDPGCSC